MPKCFSLRWLLQAEVLTVLLYIHGITALVSFFMYCSWFDYESIPLDEIDGFLLKAVNPNLKIDPEKPACSYELLRSNVSSYGRGGAGAGGAFSAAGLEGGAWAPAHCSPAFSVAVLVTYRARQRQLDLFLPYMHDFLRKQNIHYKIFLISQEDAGPWNKGVLYNAGARAALGERWPCLVLHDVDLLPLDAANLYACLRQPRHLSAAIDKFRYVLPYPSLIGGVAAISAEQFELVNGFSNQFTGWGGEDDDFAARLEAHKLPILRFGRAQSRYSMLSHRQEPPNPARHHLYSDSARRAPRDGLRDVKYRARRVVPHRLFTLVAVTV